MAEEQNIYKQETLRMRLELQELAKIIDGYQEEFLRDVKGLILDNTECFRACQKARKAKGPKDLAYETVLDITKNDRRLILVRNQLLRDAEAAGNELDGGYTGEDSESKFCNGCQQAKQDKLFCENCLGKFWDERRELMGDNYIGGKFLLDKSFEEIT